MFVSPNLLGYFKVPGGGSTLLTANQFVKHHFVVDNDPTITMKDGTKHRVFHASNPSIPMVYPSIILDKHDEMIESKKSKKKKLLKKKTGSEKPIIPPYTLGKKNATSATSTTGNLNLPFVGIGSVGSDSDDDEFIYFDDEDDEDGAW